MTNLKIYTICKKIKKLALITAFSTIILNSKTCGENYPEKTNIVTEEDKFVDNSVNKNIKKESVFQYINRTKTDRYVLKDDDMYISNNTNNTVVEKEKIYIALTFDDGPCIYTTDLLDVLDKYGIKATFFVCGYQIDRGDNKEILKDIYDRGHLIGNHSYEHKYFSNLTLGECLQDIIKNNNLIESITEEIPTLLRPPGGIISNKVKESIDMDIVLWNVDSLDWSGISTEEVIKNIENGINKRISQGNNSAVVLCHSIKHNTANTIDNFLNDNDLDTDNYEYIYVTYEQLLDLQKGNELIKK